VLRLRLGDIAWREAAAPQEQRADEWSLLFMHADMPIAIWRVPETRMVEPVASS